MNERIWELRKQALLWSGENVNRHLYTEYEIQLKEYEKFAELIVKECAELVKDFYQEDEFTCYSAKTEIKEHFEVEE